MKEGENYQNALLEEIRDQLRIVTDAVVDVQEKVEPVPQMQADIADLKTDMKVVKLAVTDTNKELKLLERRVTKLENAA